AVPGVAGLRRHVVGAARHDQRVVFRGTTGQTSQYGKHLRPDEQQRRPDLQLFDVLGEVAAGHAPVDLLVAGQRRKLLDARLHVVPRHPLTRRDRVEVDVVDHAFVRLDGAVGHVHAEVALSAQHGDPQLAFQDDLALRRPEIHHHLRGIARREDVRDHVSTLYVRLANCRSRSTPMSVMRPTIRRGSSGAPPPSVTGATLTMISSSRSWSANCPTRSPPPTNQMLRSLEAARIVACTGATSPCTNWMSAPGTAGSDRCVNTQVGVPPYHACHLAGSSSRCSWSSTH